MKELAIEQKAKRYDEAIKKAKSKIKNNKDHVLYEDDIADIFPELKEDDDEKIIEALIALLNFGLEDGSSIAPGFNETKEQALAWLEKQKDISSVEHVFRPVAGCDIVDAATKAIEQQKLGNKIVNITVHHPLNRNEHTFFQLHYEDGGSDISDGHYLKYYDGNIKNKML